MFAMPGLVSGSGAPARLNLDFIFTNNVGPNKEHRFELTFDHFLDALGEVARARYPGTDPESAFAALIANNVRPLFASIFGEEEAANNSSAAAAADGDYDGLDSQSTMTGATGAARSAARSARLVLTPHGTMPASAPSSGPAVGMMVSERNSASDKTARYEVRLGGGGGGSGAGSGAAGAGTPTSRSLNASSSSSVAGRGGGLSSGGLLSVGVGGGGGGGGPISSSSSVASSGFRSTGSGAATGAAARSSLRDVLNTLSAHVDGDGSAPPAHASELRPTAVNQHPLGFVRAQSSGGGGDAGGASAAEVAALREHIAAMIVALESLKAENVSLREENGALRSAIAASVSRK
jgi:hypothetical protein